LNIKTQVKIPTKDFYNLINNAIEISDEEFIDRVFNEIDMNEVIKSFKEEILNVYTETKTKSKSKSKVKNGPSIDKDLDSTTLEGVPK
jgi:hypothetical protein